MGLGFRVWGLGLWCKLSNTMLPAEENRWVWKATGTNEYRRTARGEKYLTHEPAWLCSRPARLEETEPNATAAPIIRYCAQFMIMLKLIVSRQREDCAFKPTSRMR